MEEGGGVLGELSGKWGSYLWEVRGGQRGLTVFKIKRGINFGWFGLKMGLG